MRTKDTDKVWATQFGSLLELVRWLETTPSTWPVSQRSSLGSGEASWRGTQTFEEAVALARDGWEEGVKNLSALVATVPNNRVMTKSFSVAGDYPDVGRAVSGDPFNMIRRGKELKPKNAMTLVVAIGGTGDVQKSEMENFGAALTALIDRLESRHVRVELLAHWGNTCWSGPDIGVTWTVKNLQDALDLSAVAFSLGHAAAMRRLGFAVMERFRKVVPGYGATRSTINKELIVDLPNGALLINGVQGAPRGTCADMAKAVAFATAKINEASVALCGEPIAELEAV